MQVAYHTAVRFTDRLLEEGIEELYKTESINGLYKTELINPGKPWRNAAHVEVETATYLRWFNYDRLFEFCGDIPPLELERNFYCQVPADQVA